MALFRRKKKEEKETHVSDAKVGSAFVSDDSGAKKTPTKRAVSDTAGHCGVLLRPRVTEKATEAHERGVYVFEVATDANKKEIARAFTDRYRISPVNVHIVPIPPKTVMQKTRRGRGIKSGGKKAYVYLKQGDTIELI